MIITFYVILFPMHLLTFTHFHFSCNFGTQPWTFIVHKLQESSTCYNNDKTNYIKRETKNINAVKYLLILNVTLVKTTESLIEILDSNNFKPVSFVIRQTLLYTHPLMSLFLS